MTRTATLLAALLFSTSLAAVPALAQENKTEGQTETQAEPKTEATQPEAAQPQAAQPAVQGDAVVATVGDVKITAAQVDQAVTEMGQRMANMPPQQARARALDALIDTYVMAELARKEGLDKDPDYERRMKQQEVRTLQALYFGKKIQNSVTDEAVRAAYDEQVKATAPKAQVRARHILLKSEDEAKAVIEEIKGGADFAEVAKAKSTGPSGPNGGDLGFFGEGQMVPEFEKAAFALEPGAVTDAPVKTQFGFHVIKVEEKREAPAPAYEQVAPQIRNNLLREAYLKEISAGREAVGVEISDETLKLQQ